MRRRSRAADLWLGQNVRLGERGFLLRKPLDIHPYASLFPLLEGDDRDQLRGDIAENGQLEPIVLLDGKVLDGQNRYRICQELGIEPKTSVYTGDDPLGFVLSKNLNRRHLTESQKAMIAAELAGWDLGVNQFSEGCSRVNTRKAIGRRLGIGATIISYAKSIRKNGVPEVVEAVVNGELSASAAVEIVKETEDVQRDLIARSEKDIQKAAKQIRARDQKACHAVRLDLAAEISQGTKALPTGQKWPVIYADPPWEQKVWGEVTGHEKSAVNHYPTMSWEDCCALCEGEKSPALGDAVLYLWIPANNIEVGLECMRRWGFAYSSQIVWDKVNQGNGRWVFDCHEVLLIGKRGNIPAPLPGTQPQSVYREPKRGHSWKPPYFAEAIEHCFPGLPKLELFNRKQSLADGDVRLSDHWTLWGNEAFSNPPALEMVG